MFAKSSSSTGSMSPAGAGRSPATTMRVGAALLGLAVAATLVIDGSRGAFSATTANGGNSVAAGTVAIADNDAEAVMFNLSNLNGGQTVSRCIKVTYSGSLTADVKLYGTVGGTGLAAGLATTIQPGTGDAADCRDFVAVGSALYSGSLSTFGTTHKAFDSGLLTMEAATNSTSKTYKVTMLVSSDNVYQGKKATADFTWEAQGKDPVPAP